MDDDPPLGPPGDAPARAVRRPRSRRQRGERSPGRAPQTGRACRSRRSGGMLRMGGIGALPCWRASWPAEGRVGLLEGVMANLGSMLEQAAADHAGRAAVRMDDLVLSYQELRDAAARLTALLSSFGIAPGDRVAVMLPNRPPFPLVFYGALGAGAVVVPMNPLLKSREVAYYLGDSGAKVLFAWHAAASQAAKGPAGTGARGGRGAQPRPSPPPAALPPAPAR